MYKSIPFLLIHLSNAFNNRLHFEKLRPILKSKIDFLKSIIFIYQISFDCHYDLAIFLISSVRNYNLLILFNSFLSFSVLSLGEQVLCFHFETLTVAFVYLIQNFLIQPFRKLMEVKFFLIFSFPVEVLVIQISHAIKHPARNVKHS